MTKQSTQNPHTRDVNAANRVGLAVHLRAQKVKYEDIAHQCGYGSAAAAHKAVMRELQRTVVENVDELRREELASLEHLERECWERLSDEKYTKSMLFAVDRILAIKERRARLMGLDLSTEAAIAAAQVIIREVPSNYLEGPKSE